MQTRVTMKFWTNALVIGGAALALAGCVINPRFSNLSAEEQRKLTPLALPANVASSPASVAKIESAKDVQVYMLDAQKLLQLIDASDKQFFYVNLYTSYCRPCIEEFPAIMQLAEANKQRMEVYLVNPQSWVELDEAKKFLFSHQVTMPTYVLDLKKYGEEFQSVARYRKFKEELYAGHPEIEAFPTHLILNKQHQVVFAAVGAKNFNQQVLDSVMRANP